MNLRKDEIVRVSGYSISFILTIISTKRFSYFKSREHFESVKYSETKNWKSVFQPHFF